MNETTKKQLESLGELGYFFARNTRERVSANTLCKIMGLIERECMNQDGSIYYVYRIRKSAIDSVVSAFE